MPVVRGSPVSNSRFSIAARIYQKGCFHVFQQRNRHSPDADACLMCVHCITLHPVRKWCICISRSDACVFADMCIDGKGSSPSLGRGKQHDRILFKGRTRLLLLLLEWMGYAKYAALCEVCSTMQSMQHYAKYAALCEVCNCFSVRTGIVFLTQSIVKHCTKYATDSTFA